MIWLKSLLLLFQLVGTIIDRLELKRQVDGEMAKAARKNLTELFNVVEDIQRLRGDLNDVERSRLRGKYRRR
jgi:hypothetical protein